MKEEVFITLVVTVYNKAKFITGCLNSIFSQTDQRFQLLVIDDDSEDESNRICWELCRGRTNTCVIHKAHGGVSEARNLGIKKAETEYIFFVDGDDRIQPDTIERLNKLLDENKYDLIVFGFYHVLNEKKLIKVSYNESSIYSFAEMKEAMVPLWDSEIMYSACNKLFKREILLKEQLYFRDKDFGEDMEFVCDYFLKCNSLHVIHECYYLYTLQSNDSLSKCFRENSFELRRQEYHFLKTFFTCNMKDKKPVKEYLARRYVERIAGCLEFESLYHNRNPASERLNKLRMIIQDSEVQDCIATAELRSIKMKLLIYPLKHRWIYLCFLSGMVITLVKHYCPSLFYLCKKYR